MELVSARQGLQPGNLEFRCRRKATEFAGHHWVESGRWVPEAACSECKCSAIKQRSAGLRGESHQCTAPKECSTHAVARAASTHCV